MDIKKKMDETKEKIKEAEKQARENIKAAEKTAKDSIEQAQEKIKEDVAQVKENIEQVQEKVKEDIEEAQERVKERIEVSQRKHHRPFYVTVVCLIGFAGIVLGGFLFALLLSPMFQQYIKKYFDIISLTDIWVFGGTLLIEIVALIGFWDMRRWGVWLYLVLFIADAVYFTAFSGMHLALIGFFYPAAVIGIGFVSYKKMRD